jgi:hypothetical protein
MHGTNINEMTKFFLRGAFRGYANGSEKTEVEEEKNGYIRGSN